MSVSNIVRNEDGSVTCTAFCTYDGPNVLVTTIPAGAGQNAAVAAFVAADVSQVLANSVGFAVDTAAALFSGDLAAGNF